jgi:hypothetical protein
MLISTVNRVNYNTLKLLSTGSVKNVLLPSYFRIKYNNQKIQMIISYYVLINRKKADFGGVHIPLEDS